MEWRGVLGATITQSGYRLDLVKSALQKYIRRGNAEKALYAATELYRLGEVGGQAPVTNLYNRLAIIAGEDVGPADWSLALTVIHACNTGNRDFPTLLAMVQLLAQTEHTRMMSHVWFAYADEQGRHKASEAGLQIDSEFSHEDLVYIDDHDINAPDDLKPYALAFQRRLETNDFNAFGWARFFLDAAEGQKIPLRPRGDGKKTSKPDVILWDIMRPFLREQATQILVTAYYNHAENLPFLQSGILAALYREPFVPYDLAPVIAEWSESPLLSNFLSGDYSFKIDDFAYDKHTAEGRAKGADLTKFVREGAKVENQSEKYFDEGLAAIYDSLK